MTSSTFYPNTPPTAASPGPASSVSSLSVKDFFLKQLTPRVPPSAWGRSDSVQQFRYGSSLTSEECFACLRKTAAVKGVLTQGGCGTARPRGNARGRGKTERAPASPPRTRSSGQHQTIHTNRTVTDVAPRTLALVILYGFSATSVTPGSTLGAQSSLHPWMNLHAISAPNTVGQVNGPTCGA